MAEKMLEQFGQMVRSSEQYPVDFDQAWQWVGYVRKDYALDTLKANFEERLDYSGVDRNRSDGKPGKPYRAYFLTVDCFKSFCMMAGTGKGREVRKYYLQIEQKYLELQQASQIRETGGYVPEGMAVVRKDILDRMCDRLAETIQETCRLNRVVAASGQPRADLEQVKQDVAEIKEDRRLIHYLIDKNEKLQRRGTRLSEDERRDIWFKHRSGMAVARIEQETGRDASSIRRIIKRGYRR